MKTRALALLIAFSAAHAQEPERLPAATPNPRTAEELAAQTADKDLQSRFAPLAKTLTENEQKIAAELAAVQGKPVDIGGYYMPDLKKLSAVMRPSATFNAALDSVKA